MKMQWKRKICWTQATRCEKWPVQCCHEILECSLGTCLLTWQGDRGGQAPVPWPHVSLAPLGLKDPTEDTRLCLSLSIFLEKTSGLPSPFCFAEEDAENFDVQFVSGHAAKHRSRQLLVHEQTAGRIQVSLISLSGCPAWGSLGSLLLFRIRQP